MSSLDSLIGYRTLLPGNLWSGKSGALYDYVLAGNGLFVAATRAGLDACIPVAAAHVHGLPDLKPTIRISTKVPAEVVARMFYMARIACAEGLREELYHIRWWVDEWLLTVPEQTADAGSVTPAGATAGTSYETALIDVHSHHVMKFDGFSATDDESEAGLFRIFGVLCDIFEHPTLVTRVTIFNHSWEFDPRLVFEIPAGVTIISTRAPGHHGR